MNILSAKPTEWKFSLSLSSAPIFCERMKTCIDKLIYKF